MHAAPSVVAVRSQAARSSWLSARAKREEGLRGGMPHVFEENFWVYGVRKV
jgi:hypothetical protein